MRTFLKIMFVLICMVGIFYWSGIKGSALSAQSEPLKIDREEKSTTGITITKRWDLPDILKEISDLAFLDGDRFVCVQDELGKIFVYNTASSKIEKELDFGGPGDYEGIALVNATAWVLRSDGRLFEVNDINSKQPEVKEYATHLTAALNVEGICYDKKNNRLLLAIKDGEPGNVDYKGVYAFDLATHKMPGEPVLKISLQNQSQEDAGGKKKNSGTIMPSSIAIQPETRDIYITDGRHSRLLIIEPNGSVRKLYDLDPKDFAQPEGIAFKPGGEIFISNEGNKQPGNILKVEINGN